MFLMVDDAQCYSVDGVLGDDVSPPITTNALPMLTQN